MSLVVSGTFKRWSYGLVALMSFGICQRVCSASFLSCSSSSFSGFFTSTGCRPSSRTACRMPASKAGTATQVSFSAVGAGPSAGCEPSPVVSAGRFPVRRRTTGAAGSPPAAPVAGAKRFPVGRRLTGAAGCGTPRPSAAGFGAPRLGGTSAWAPPLLALRLRSRPCPCIGAFGAAAGHRRRLPRELAANAVLCYAMRCCGHQAVIH